MKPYVWKDGMSEKEMRDGAYFERNMLALLLAKVMNLLVEKERSNDMFSNWGKCGWYLHGEWEGWTHVISLDDGRMTFHVPDDFDMGDLPQIEPNWDNHTTEEKWLYIMNLVGCELPE